MTNARDVVIRALHEKRHTTDHGKCWLCQGDADAVIEALASSVRSTFDGEVIDAICEVYNCESSASDYADPDAMSIAITAWLRSLEVPA